MTKSTQLFVQRSISQTLATAEVVQVTCRKSDQKKGKLKNNFFFLSNWSSLSSPAGTSYCVQSQVGGRHASCLSSTEEKPLVKITSILQLHSESGSVSFCHSECGRKGTTWILSAVWGIHSFFLGLFLGTSPSFLNHRDLLPP